jgi:hypothetical protein
MAAITVDGTEDNAIAADASRTYLQFQVQTGTYPVRWSFGATYDTGDNQLLQPGDPMIITGTIAQLAVSFKKEIGIGVVETLLQP